MEKDTIDYIKNKSFAELSMDEKEEMKELFTTESEFNEIKALFFNMDGHSATSFSPSQKVKEKLDDIFVQKYPASHFNSFLALIVPKNKPFYRQPLVQIVALALLLLIVVPFFNTPLVKETIQVTKVEKLKDATNLKELKNTKETKSEAYKTKKEPKIVEPERQMSTPVKPSTRNSQKSIQTPESKLIVLEAEPSLTLIPSENKSKHPDGIYTGEMEEVNFLSVSADEQVELLDILTVTF